MQYNALMFYKHARVHTRMHSRELFLEQIGTSAGIAAMAEVAEPPEEWDNEHFMSCARLAATRSKDPKAQVNIPRACCRGILYI